MIISLLKAIDILELFSPECPRLTLAEIAAQLELPKSTAHNLLRTMLSRGLIEKVDGDHYALGSAIISLTQAVRINVELRDRAAPMLRELADVCHESVLLAIKDGYYSLYIYAVESPRRLLARTAVGDRVPMHCTAIGKAILSYLPQKEVEEIVAHVGMPPSTDATIIEMPTLLREMELTRQRGYSLDRQEHEASTFCIGAPIFNASGRVIAACSVSGSDPEIISSKLDQISRRVVITSQEISRLMGYIPIRNGLVVTRSSVEMRAR